ncbi:hypothetical protein ACFFHJ_35000 [Planotetraspora thailandica]|uniref:hypothetical protein n=1 Tax=Planotetraspora thailandica TaxID=487172 RepID=UPI00194F116E|nr:hypothetical protein [Planotetraspora thailandica]
MDPAQGIVSFRCEIGTATGRWKGSTPANEGFYDVEFEIPEEVQEWEEPAPGVPAISEIGEDVRVTGEVLGVGEEDDHVVELRTGTDILLIEIPDAGRRARLKPHDVISFRSPEIWLYPYQL